MFEWSEEHQMIREAVKRFVDEEVRPHVEELEHGDLPPYDIIRKMLKTFGMDSLARDRFATQIAREKSLAERGEEPKPTGGGGGRDAGMSMIPTIELCRVCPGMVTAMGVSMGLTAGAIMSRGTARQKERWARDLLTLDKIGAWAITEPGSGSDAFGGMRSTARRDGDHLQRGGAVGDVAGDRLAFPVGLAVVERHAVPVAPVERVAARFSQYDHAHCVDEPRLFGNRNEFRRVDGAARRTGPTQQSLGRDDLPFMDVDQRLVNQITGGQPAAQRGGAPFDERGREVRRAVA